MIKDWQAGACVCLSNSGMKAGEIARRLGMAENSVRKHSGAERLPSQAARKPREYRTRQDPLAAYWPRIAERLQAEPRLKPFAILEWLKEQYAGQVSDSIRRSLERRVQNWKMEHDVQQEVMFPQDHQPADLMAFDFVDLGELGITIRSQPFPHLMFHAVFTYSNWEHLHLCHTESFEALSHGLQDALHLAGGVPRRVRSDSLTAAVNNLSCDREFQPRYAGLLKHYGLEGHRINVRKPHENGDVESSHGHLKEALRQALYLRGNSNFTSSAEYEAWARGVVAKRNRGRQAVFQREFEHLRPLPHSRLDAFSSRDVRVRSDSLLHIRQNTYSVNSKLIGLKIEARVQQDEIELWYGGQCVERMPRQFGKGQVLFDYRHVIDSLIRKPGAFRNYRYVEYLFPTIQFRRAYDQLCQGRSEIQAVKQYLKILEAAKYEGQERVEDALRGLLTAAAAISADAVLAIVRGNDGVPLPTRVNVEPPNLNDFDTLLQHKDVYDETSSGETNLSSSQVEQVPTDQSNASGGALPDELPAEGTRVSDGQWAADRPDATGRTTQGATATDLSGGTPIAGRPCGERALDTHAVSGGIGDTGMPCPDAESGRSPAEELEASAGQDLGAVQVVSPSADGGPAIRAASRGKLPGSTNESADLWQARIGEDKSVMRAGRRTGSSGAIGMLHDLPDAGATTADRETRSAVGTVHQVACQVRGPDHRRPGLCPTKSRGDGSSLHAPLGALRTWQRAVELQLAVLEVGPDLQGPHDDSRGDRSLDPSFGHRRTEHPELSIGGGRGPSETTNHFRRIGTRILDLVRRTFYHANLIVAKEQN